MTQPTTVYRPALNVYQTGGSTVIVDGDGNIQQIIGQQPDGTYGVTTQNGAAPEAVSTPVVTDATEGLTVTWDGLMADQTAGDPLNSNTDFESAVSPWLVMAGGTIAQSTTQAHGGTSSGQVAPSGSADTVTLSSEAVPVTGGSDYQVDGWAWITDSVTAAFSLGISWYDASNVLLSTSSTLDDLTASDWSEVLNVYTAPSDAASAAITITLTTPGTDIDAGQIFYLDDVTIRAVQFDTPADFDHVAVHVSETSGFTPSAETLTGTLTHAGNYPVSPLTGGTTYYVRLVGVNTSGVSGPASAQASGTPSEVVATSILDGIVTTVKLADDAVTQAKIDAGAVGSAQIQGNAVDLSKLADGSVDATKLVTGAVGSDALQADAVIAGKVAAGAIGTNELAANSVVAGKIAADSVDTAQLVAGSVETAQIAAGAVQAGQIAADAVTTDALEALAVTAAKIAANTITAGQIAAGAITADLLAATLVLASTIIAGTALGTRVQIDSTGINAYDQDGNNTVNIGSDGSASFTGSNVSATEVDAERVIINSSTDGGVFLYGSSSAALNANPDFATGITSWTSTATVLTYSATHTYNGHNTLRGMRTGGAATVESATFSVLAGDNYQLLAAVLSSDGTPIYCSIRWLNASGTEIGHVNSSTSTETSFALLTTSGTAPAGTTQAKIRIGFTVDVDTAAFYVGSAGVSATNLFTSLTNTAGTDSLGNVYPVGLQTSAANIGNLTAGNIKAGAESQRTTTNGRVTFNNPFGGTTPKFVVSIGALNSKYSLQVISVASDVVTLQVFNTTDGSNAVGDQTVNFTWIGMK